MEHTGFPSDETLAAFLDGRLDPDTRRRVVEHMTTCDECYATVTGGGEMPRLGTAATEAVRGSWKRIFGLALAATLACVVIGIGVFRRTKPETTVPTAVSVVPPQLQQVAAAAPDERRIATRLTAFPWAPEVRITRGGSTELSNNPKYWRLLGVAGTLGQEAQQHPTPDNLHAVGVSHIVLEHWDDGVLSLTDALQAQTRKTDLTEAIAASRDVRLLSDLAAAIYERGVQMDRPPDRFVALTAANAAWRLAHTPEIAWNRAVILESIDKAAAVKAWNEYLSLDSSSRWSVEARESMAKLTQPSAAVRWRAARLELASAISRGDEVAVARIVDEFPQPSRMYLEHLIATMSSEDAPASVTMIAAALARRGDATLGAVVEAWKRAPIDQRRAFCDALKGYEAGQINDAERALIGLVEANSSLSPVMRQFVLFTTAACQFSGGRVTDAERTLKRLPADAGYSTGHYRLLDAKVAWVRGLIALAQQKPSEALAAYEESSSIFAQLGETESGGVIDGFRAEVLDSLGMSDAAWSLRLHALAELTESQSTARLNVALQESIQAAIKNPLYIEFADLASMRYLELASSVPSAAFAADAWTWRALVLLRRGDRSAASEAMREADRATTLVDAGARKRSEATLAWAHAETDRAGNPRAVVDAATVALKDSAASGYRFRTARLYLLRGEALTQLGEREAGRRDFQQGIAVVQGERAALDSESHQIALLDVTESLFSNLVRSHLAEGGWKEALAVLESYRGRSLLDASGSSVGQARDTSAAVMERVPESAAIVEYFLSDDGLSAWVIRKETIRYVQQVVARESLLESAAQHGTNPGTDGKTSAGARLYEVFVRPIRPLLGDAKTLAIVAPRELQRMPFASLYDGAAGQYLAEQFALVTAPSAALAVIRQQGRFGRSSHVLLVANAAYGTSAGALTSVKREQDSIERLYLHPQVLGADDTKKEFLAMIGGCDVLHVAGHAVRPNRFETPALLAFNTSTISVSDLALGCLRRAPLVILAGCETSTGIESNSEGQLSLSRAFLRAGASDVVATTLPVDDEAASLLFPRFHQLLVQGMSPAAALQQVQIEAIHSPIPEVRTPASWAAIQLIGAV